MPNMLEITFQYEKLFRDRVVENRRSTVRRPANLDDAIIDIQRQAGMLERVSREVPQKDYFSVYLGNCETNLCYTKQVSDIAEVIDNTEQLLEYFGGLPEEFQPVEVMLSVPKPYRKDIREWLAGERTLVGKGRPIVWKRIYELWP